MKRNFVVDQMQQAGFVVVSLTPHTPSEFEVWVMTRGCEPLEPLYLEIREADNSLYWWDFTHTTLICRLDAPPEEIQHRFQDLYQGKLNPIRTPPDDRRTTTPAIQ